MLSLIAQQTVTTDQGQTIVNDNYTQMINNLRLEIENDIGWIWSEGTDLDFALDSNFQLPAQNITAFDDFHGPSFKAFQGVEPGAQNAFPLVNDPSEFGNTTLGTFTFTNTASSTTTFLAVTGLNGGTDLTAGLFAVTFQDGRIAYFPYTGAAGAAITTIGTNAVVLNSIAVVPPVGLPVGGTWIEQAAGWTNVLNQPLASEVVTIPVQYTVITATVGATAGTAFTSALGGVNTTVNNAAVTANAYGQMAGRNPNFNKGFLDRVTILQNASSYKPIAVNAVSTLSGATATFGGHQYFYVAILPLKTLHDCKYLFHI